MSTGTVPEPFEIAKSAAAGDWAQEIECVAANNEMTTAANTALRKYKENLLGLLSTPGSRRAEHAAIGADPDLPLAIDAQHPGTPIAQAVRGAEVLELTLGEAYQVVLLRPESEAALRALDEIQMRLGIGNRDFKRHFSARLNQDRLGGLAASRLARGARPEGGTTSEWFR